MLNGTGKLREIEERFLTAEAQRDYDDTWRH